MTYTLVIMAYQRPRSLHRGLSAIARIDYDPSEFEVVVVDDGSSPSLEPVVREFQSAMNLRYRRIPHGGVAVARNAGLAIARGRFVCFVADDHALPPTYLRSADAFFRSRPHAEVVSFNMRSRGPSPARHVQQMYLELTLLQNAGAEPDEQGVIRSFSLPASRAAVFRRSVFDRVGPFDDELTSGEDGEMGARLADAGIPVHFLPACYVDHWEEKTFRDFLRQRVAYATSFHRLLKAREEPGARSTPWTSGRCLREVARRLRGWAEISRRTGRLGRFVLVLPGLVIFLGVFYGTIYRCERRHVRRPRRVSAERRAS